MRLVQQNHTQSKVHSNVNVNLYAALERDRPPPTFIFLRIVVELPCGQLELAEFLAGMFTVNPVGFP